MKQSASRRLSRWFVSHQKKEYWTRQKLKTLQITIVTLILLAYVCHIVASPLIKISTNEVAGYVYAIESVLLVLGVASFSLMLWANGSNAAAKMLFRRKNIDTYIYLFWAIRSFVVEILKSQVLFAFLHIFHTIVLFSSDSWHICNRGILIVNFTLFLSIMVYEFLVTISPVAPKLPEWTFLNVKTTPNSLSRSNQFNLFIIFWDALIVLLFDPERSKYIFLSDIAKRKAIKLSDKQYSLIVKLFSSTALSAFLMLMTYVAEIIVPKGYLTPTVYNVIIGVLLLQTVVSYVIIIKMTKTNDNILFKLIQERRVIFIIIILLFDTSLAFFIPSETWINVIGFPIVVFEYIVSDLFGDGYIPMNFFRVMMTMLMILLLFNTVWYTFFETKCVNFPWGLYGEDISFCSMKRIINQSIASLFLSSILSIIIGKTENLFFVNIHLYRSTGTTEKGVQDDYYVTNMVKEKTLKNLRSKKKETMENVVQLKSLAVMENPLQVVTE